ncbi:MAG: metallophosphoesterase [Chitinispirillaceae bacterium]
MRTTLFRLLIVTLLTGVGLVPTAVGEKGTVSAAAPRKSSSTAARVPLLTDPFLQLPTTQSVRVIWFTEFEGSSHWVSLGEMPDRPFYAKTSAMSRLREDHQSWYGRGLKPGEFYTSVEKRRVYRHEAVVTGLKQNRRYRYEVTSVREDGAIAHSGPWSLAATPHKKQPLKILLTSDIQLKPMAPANFQKVVQTVSDTLDAVFIAGDLVNIPDRGTEWFDDSRGLAFFPVLQGNAFFDLEKNGTVTRYTGGEIIQHAPVFTALGNHEVMGITGLQSLGREFNSPRPAFLAGKLYGEATDSNSYNTTTYEEIFTLPESPEGHERYYACTFGDIRLISLMVTRIWRRGYDNNQKSTTRYQEARADYADSSRWGYGNFIFEPIKRGSPQFRWLKKELDSKEYREATYKIVMFHHQHHSLGSNAVPAFTDPVQNVAMSDDTIRSITYEYPLEKDYIARDVIPLLEEAGVHLVLYGHSHLWNRYRSESGMHFLETSNVGNSYGAYFESPRSGLPPDLLFAETYVAKGNPYGLDPIMPTIAPVEGKPYITSNDLTVFSVLDTRKGSVASYYFNTKKPESEVVKFDEFILGH